MKTLPTLPTLPEGWRWAYHPVTRTWSAIDPAQAAELEATAKWLRRRPPFGTPPAGSTVWGPHIGSVLYQPEGT